MNKKQFGELEWTIIKILQTKGKCSVKDIHDICKENAYTTIMTVMSRMYEKGILTRYKEGRNYIYSIKDKRQIPQLLENIKRHLFSGSSFEMISYLIENSDISQKELEKIENILTKHNEK